MGEVTPLEKRAEGEIQWLQQFGDFLKSDEKRAFADLIEKLRQSELYRPMLSGLDSAIRQMPLILSVLFIHHKKIFELERRNLATATVTMSSKTDKLHNGESEGRRAL